MKYTLENTCNHDDGSEDENGLRWLITFYSSFFFKTLNEFAEFRELLTPDFASPLLDFISEGLE